MPAWAGRTPGSWRPASGPTWWRCGLDTVRTAGALPAQLVLVAGAADVDTVLVDGRPVVSGGRHVLGDVAGLLAEAIAPLWS